MIVCFDEDVNLVVVAVVHSFDSSYLELMKTREPPSDSPTVLGRVVGVDRRPLFLGDLVDYWKGLSSFRSVW